MTKQAPNEAFLTLVSVVRENEKERQKMLSILDLEPTRRKIAINILATEMRLKKAPEEFVEAWDALQDDGLAEAAKQLILDQNQAVSLDPMSVVAVCGIGILALGLLLAMAFLLNW